MLSLALLLLLLQATSEASAAEPLCDVSAVPEPPGGAEGKEFAACPGPRPEQLLLDTRGKLARLEPTSATDVTHYQLELEVIPEYSGQTVTGVRIEGVSTIDFEPTVDGLGTFTVDLHDALTVSSVTGNVSSWMRVGSTVEIILDRAYDTGEEVHVGVAYEGVPEDAGFGAFQWWMRNGDLFVATLSEPFFAHYWWPCKDALDDKATMQMHVTVPAGMVALSNGLELGSQVLPGDRVRYSWEETYPMIPYLASLAIGSYERYELSYLYDDGGSPGTLSVPCYVYPDHWDYGAGEPFPDHKSGCDELLDMLQTFSPLFGTYPWIAEKYGVVETGDTGGLNASMEHQTLSSMRRVSGYSNIMSHELAHQWWGDEVTCETWYDIWLNEGFASYAEFLYREWKPGGSMDLYWERVNQRRPGDPDAQVYRTDVSTAEAIFSGNDVYNKGSWVLHMLRHVVGDELFFASLADYRLAFQNDSATTAEFTTSISSSIGHDMSWLTDQWVMSPGSPDYEWSYRAETIAGARYLKLAIWQRQDAEGYDLFSMPIDIRVTTTFGTSTHRVWNDDWEEYYVLGVDGPVLNVGFDEDGGVPDRNWVLSDSRTLVSTPLEPPPVLLDVGLPARGSLEQQAAIALTFSEDIGSFEPADLMLTGELSGAHTPIDWIYTPDTRTAVLTYPSLPPDDYVLSIFDADVSAHGKALDGEIVALPWGSGATLPSGDGQPGGDVILAFSLSALPIPFLTAQPGFRPLLLMGIIAVLWWRGLRPGTALSRRLPRRLDGTCRPRPRSPRHWS